MKIMKEKEELKQKRVKISKQFIRIYFGRNK